MQQDEENAVRCRSPFCNGTYDGLKGRLFIPPEGARNLSLIWCENCVKVGTEMKFFSQQTANMVREKFAEYRPEALPHNVRVVLTQFAREIVEMLGEEL